MNGLTIASQGQIGVVTDPNFSIVGSGDYNGNGAADILWRHAGTGQNYIWFMNGLAIAAQGVVDYVPNVWRVVGKKSRPTCVGRLEVRRFAPSPSSQATRR
ncbi:MAG TPA: hypothetical protein VNA69_05490 [Thermoanaerobaculia bacterium]|nr:hypothetical protein [Thermoanaerobaculia bacterium]